MSISFGSSKKQVEVIHDISFDINENEILGVVGESGSGKSVTSMAILGLLPKKSSQLKGEILFEGKNLILEKENILKNYLMKIKLLK